MKSLSLNSLKPTHIDMQMILVALACVALTSAAPQAPKEPIAILRSAQDQSPDGGYAYSFETGNHIIIDESAQINGDVKTVKGSYSYTDPDGTPVQISYSVGADGGFVAEGAALPQAPALPELPAELAEAIAKAVAKAAEEDSKLSPADLEEVATGKWLARLWAKQA